jgi:hypothetical protein
MIELDNVLLDAADRPDWFHRPFTRDEIDQHPDRERLLSTLEAVASEAVRQWCAMQAMAIQVARSDEGLRLVHGATDDR